MADHHGTGSNVWGTIAIVLFNMISASTKSDVLFIASLLLTGFGIVAHYTTIKKNTKQ
ncbi:hypothetical protein Pan5_20 [Pseudanabaena phage Pan5]|nr:hypothetical protein Pan5_20 [Pseudanabaena phage Pan5]